MTKLKRIDTGSDKYFFVSDGTNVLYIEKDDKRDSYGVSTVHKPNVTTGTGFRLIDAIGPASLLAKLPVLLKTFAPSWAKQKELASVKKYGNLEEFVNSRWEKNIVVRDFMLD